MIGGRGGRLRRYWGFSLGLLVVLLAVFAVVEWRGVGVLRDPSGLLAAGGGWAAVGSVGLLVADVFLPIPSSVIMIGNGALFGVAAGASLSLVGSVGASALAFLVGRRSARWIERLVSPGEKAHADALLARWGALAIVVTRPIPLLAEATAILAGSSPLSWPRLLLASAAGTFPSCLLYALTGAHSRSFGSGAFMFADGPAGGRRLLFPRSSRVVGDVG